MARSVLQQELQRRDAFLSPEQEAGLNVLRTASVLTAPFTRLFKQYGISQPQYNILHMLKQEGSAGLQTQEISARMITMVPDVTRLIDRLEQAKLIERTRGASDRRVVQVAITRKGAERVARLEPLVVQVHADNLGHMSRAELKQISSLMAKARHVNA